MAYFPNGTSGEMYEDEYCSRCVHGEDGGAGSCAVWLAHFLYNSDNSKRKVLDVLIPMKEGGIYPAQCAMFRERLKVDPECQRCHSEESVAVHKEWCPSK